MAKIDTEIEIKVDDSDLKEIVRLRCFNKECKHSMLWNGETSCNLKGIVIGHNGKCSEFEKITEEYKKEKELTIYGTLFKKNE